MSQHALLYTHKCCETDLKKLPKAPTLEEKFPEPTPPVEKPASPPKKRKKAKVIVPPSEESEEDDWPVVPPPPPLVRQPAQMSYREILEIRRGEMQRAKAHREVGAIRAFFRR